MTSTFSPATFASGATPIAPDVIAVELVGMTDARVDGVPFTLSAYRARSGVLPKIARALIAAGRDPSTIVRVTRGTTRVFHDAPLSLWAGITVEEGDGTSARFRPYVPRDFAVKGEGSDLSRWEGCPQDGR